MIVSRLLWMARSLRRSDAGEPRTPYDLASNQGAHQWLGACLAMLVGVYAVVPALGLDAALAALAAAAEPLRPAVFGTLAVLLIGWGAWEAGQYASGRRGVRARWDSFAADMANECAAPALLLALTYGLPVWAAVLISALCVAVPAALLGRIPGEK